MPPVTVCQLLHTLNVGGAEVLSARLVRRLRERCRFVFVCLDEKGPLGEELEGEGFPVTVLGRRPGLDIRCIWALAGALRRERVDVVHAHQYTPFFYALAARLIYRRPPLVFTEHGRHQPDFPRRKRMFYNRLLLARRDRVVAVGEAVRTALIDNEGITPQRIEVIYNGVDPSRFRSGEDRKLARLALGLTPEDFVIVQVARLDYLKDHATALRTMVRVVQRIPAARLLLVGSGPEEASIRQGVRELGLEQCVKLLGLQKDIPQLLCQADVFLLTSISEGIPLTIIEAMCASVPVVSTRVGGTPELVLDGETGLTAGAGDDEGLAAAIFRLANDPPLRQAITRRALERACDLFTEDRMVRRYLELYLEGSDG